MGNQISVDRIDKSRMVELLRPLSFEIGEWNQIKIAGDEAGKSRYAKIRAPQNARELFFFSQHVAGWLPIGNMRLLQLDYATSLSVIEDLLLSRWLFGVSGNESSLNQASILLQQHNGNSRIIDVFVAQIINLLLQFECHAEIVSTGSQNDQILSLQDGFVYFIGVAEMPEVIRQFEKNRDRSPQWVIEFGDSAFN